jgi:hypothetical protein
MFDNLLQNKYFCIAIIIALIVAIYMYSQKKSCDVEGMQNVDLTTTAQELTETPWTTRPGGDNHKVVGDRFDRFADAFVKNKLKRNGYSYTDFLKRSDQEYIDYVSQEGYRPLGRDKGNARQRKFLSQEDDVPRPLDSHPELSQCQPCRCPDDELIATDYDGADSESEQIIIIKKPNKSKKVAKKSSSSKKLKN